MLKKKSLGQNFLRSPHYVAMIAETAQLKQGEQVLEIGPGDGALTSVLLERGAKVIAIEKDRRLIPLLREKFAKEISDARLQLIEEDILHFDISKYVKKNPYKIVANIPYYITGAVIKKYLTEKNKPSHMVLLLQKEVAQRITGHPRAGSGSLKESILSLSVKAYGSPKYIKTVPRGAFAPAPNVDSAILAISDISDKNFDSEAHEKRFFALIKAGFAQKRKLLARNLEKMLGNEHSNILENVGISPKARAEDVSFMQWLELSRLSR